MKKKIYVICPGDSVTGGPELLHQLVHGLNERDCDASIIYYPFNLKFEIPEQYSHYNVKIKKLSSIDKENGVVVLPEVVTGFSRYFSNMRVFIWWLSIDNYFKSYPKGLKASFFSFLGKSTHICIDKMNNFEHLVQSQYAQDFLSNYGYNSLKLTDYLNKEHFIKDFNPKIKENIVCYNPKKGYEITKKIIDNNPSVLFVPIKNMTATQVSDLLERAKVYIDFGDHPGKDRIPREAAMAGCIVITGRKGSAMNNIDIPVNNRYKLDEKDGKFFINISNELERSLNNYNEVSFDFDNYRKVIINEENEFNKEIDYFKKLVN